MTKPLTKVWRCPTCDVGFMAGEAREGNAVGRRCPEGHFHSYYELRRHEDGKPIRVQRKEPKAKAPERIERSVSGEVEMLATLWLGAIDGLLAQMPERSTARQMIEGATRHAYRVTQQLSEAAR